MLPKTPGEAPVGITEQAVSIFLLLSLIIGLFSPWEDYINHQEFSLAAAPPPKGFSISHALIFFDYFLVFMLASLNVKLVLKSLRFLLPVLLLCGWILLSARWSANVTDSINRVGRLFFAVLFAWYMAARYGSAQWAGVLTRAYAIVVFASLAIMLLAPDLGYSGLGGANSLAWRGALVHKNSLGATMAFGAIISAYSLLTRANHRALSLLTLLGCVALLVMSRSLTAIISAVVALLVAVAGGFLQSRQRAPVLRAFALGGFGFLLLLGLIAPFFDIDLSRLPGLAGRSGSLSGRTEVWHAVWIAIRERSLLGYGYGFWDQASVMRTNIWRYLNWAPPHAHSNWLDAWLQIGLIGLMLTAATWLIAVRRAAWLTVIGYRHGSLLYLTLLCCALSQSYSETIQLSPGISAVFWWVGCYLCVARSNHLRKLGSATSHAPLATSRSVRVKNDPAYS